MMAATPWKSIALLCCLGGTVTAGAATLALRGPDPTSEATAIRGGLQAPAASKARPEAPAEAAKSKSILANESVEEGEDEGPKAWKKGADIPGVEYFWSHQGHKTTASLCLKKTANRYFPIAQWSQTVDRQGDAPRLKVSAWVKADQATKGILDAQFIDGKGKQTHAWVAYIGPQETGKPPVTHDWKRYEGVVTIPPDTKQIIIAPQIYGPGTLWFDDLAAEYTEDPTIDPTAR